jgi:protein-S-isoprenylcysteine O-methyltransferase Ste14
VVGSYDEDVRRAGSVVGTAIFLVVAPGTTVILIPWLLTDWNGRVPPLHPAIRLTGLGLVVAGAAVLPFAFARFVAEGRGTPAPVAPTERLVVGGLYRYVRNPMYLAVAATIVGQALIFGRFELLVYAVVFLLTTAAFVRLYEEPTLHERYGAEYEEYRRAVPGWWPRRRPWQPSQDR